MWPNKFVIQAVKGSIKKLSPLSLSIKRKLFNFDVVMLVSDRALHEEGKCHINKAGYNDITVIFKCKDKKSRFWKFLIKISCFGNRRKCDSSLTSKLFHKKKWGKLKLGGLPLYHLDLNLFIHGYLFVPLKFIVSFNHPHPSTLRHTHPSTLRYTHLPTLR